MITNYIIPPHTLLKPFISNYIFSTSFDKKVCFKTNWFASNENCIIFFLEDTFMHFSSDVIKPGPLHNKQNFVLSVLSNFNGEISFEGIFKRFIVQLKPDGLYKLSGIPATYFANKILSAEDIFNYDALYLHEQLKNTPDANGMASYADQFFLKLLNRPNNHHSITGNIGFAAVEINNNDHLFKINEFACKANMSTRNFERRFKNEIGVSPKLYQKLSRFNNAILKKLSNPEKRWTDVCHECGYFDQMHMIKDFKQFANQNPLAIFPSKKSFSRPRIDLVSANSKTFSRLNDILPDEKFVLVNKPAM